MIQNYKSKKLRLKKSFLIQNSVNLRCVCRHVYVCEAAQYYSSGSSEIETIVYQGWKTLEVI